MNFDIFAFGFMSGCAFVLMVWWFVLNRQAARKGR